MDTTPSDKRPVRRDDPYTYTPALPDAAATPAAPASSDYANGANGSSINNYDGQDERVANEPSTMQMIPATASAAPGWEWQPAAGALPPPPPPANGWYTVAGDATAHPVDYAPPGSGPAQGGWRQTPIGRWLSRTWVLLLIVLSKAKWLLVIFKLKAFATFGSLLVSLGFYALAFGPAFAVGFIALLFIHELGHALVMRQQGIKTTPILFIPFMGAVIGMKEMPKNVYAEAKMALGGPILGSVGALGCIVLYQVTGQPLFVALATVGFWLNLFNLIPVSPLDGGRAMAAISPWGWFAGLLMLALLFLRVHSIFLGFILLVGGYEVFNRWRNRHADRAYYEATLQQRLTITVVYFGLAAVLAFATFYFQSHVLAGQPVR